MISAVPIILTDTDTSNNRPDYEYYRCIGAALLAIFVNQISKEAITTRKAAKATTTK